MLDTAVEGYAIDTLQWLLKKWFYCQWSIRHCSQWASRNCDTQAHAYTQRVFVANNEQCQFGALNRSLKMWQILIKAGADDTIAQPDSNADVQTPLQKLLQSNVVKDIATVVQAFVALNTSRVGLSAPQQLKLTQSIQTPIQANKQDGGQIDTKYCAQRQLEYLYEANAYK